MMFESEADLVDVLLEHLRQAAPWGVDQLSVEFDYSAGRTDVIGRLQGGAVLALEAKLTKWRKAVQQAYRNTSFAHRSVVALPPRAGHVAMRHRAEFERRGIGLCIVTSDSLEWVIPPPSGQPLLPPLTQRALSRLSG